MTHGTEPMNDSHDIRPMSRTKMIVTSALVVGTFALLLVLGTWQVQRLHWKEQLLADMAERQTAAPVGANEISALLASGQNIEYRRMQVNGRFDHAHERHFFATHQGRTGFYVYTPLTLSSGQVLFINRGFVPYDLKDPALRPEGQVEGEVTVSGYARARLDGKPSVVVPDNDPAKNVFYWKDLDAMSSTAGLDASDVLPFFMDADASQTNPGGWPQGGVTQFTLTNNHLQYAVTWYGLAGALVVVVGVLWRRRPFTRGR